jgi:hypothetical protein
VGSKPTSPPIHRQSVCTSTHIGHLYRHCGRTFCPHFYLQFRFWSLLSNHL